MFQEIPIENHSDQRFHTYAYYKGALTPEICNGIVQGAQKDGFKQSVVVEGQVDSQIRSSRNAWLDMTKNLQVASIIRDIVLDANKVFNFEISSFETFWQLTEYNVGDYYNWHQDVSTKYNRRKLAVVVNLTDPSLYEGGELQFFNAINDEPIKELGSVYVFPTYEPHRVRPVKSGTRYSLVTWVMGSPFR